MTDAAPALDPDGFVMHLDGTVTVALDDGVRRLRRPKLGQLRRLRELRSRLADDLARQSSDVRARASELPAPKDQSDEDRQLGRKLVSDLTDAQEAAGVRMLRTVFDGGELDGEPIAGLADVALPPDDDDLPAWFADGRWEPVKQLLDHWQFVPPPRGAR